MKGVLGVDPGLSGGLAIIHEDGLIFEPMPAVEGLLNLYELVSWLTSHKDDIEFAFLEKVHAMPAQGVSSVFKFGRVYGAVEALLVATGIPYELVTPQKWQKTMYAGIEGHLEGKARSFHAASRLFPGVDFRASSRAKKAHEGCIEASLIAEWGRRQRKTS